MAFGLLGREGLRRTTARRLGNRDALGVGRAHEREILRQHDERGTGGDSRANQPFSLGKIAVDVGAACHLSGCDAKPIEIIHP